MSKSTTTDLFGLPLFFPPSNRNNPRYEKLKLGVLSDWILAVLKTAATKRMAPTMASRFYFLVGVLVHDTLRVIHTGWSLADMMMKDLGNFPHVLTPSSYDAWIEVAVRDGLYTLFQNLQLPSTHLDTVSAKHASQYKNIYRIFSTSVPVTPLRQDWKNRVSAYLQKRAQDGSAQASIFQPASEYPNNGEYISTSEDVASTQDLTSLPQPDKWCALDVVYDGTSHQQKYLTPQWGDVVGVISDLDKERLITRIWSSFYPSTNLHQQEILDVLEKCQHLEIKEKVSAEFWAGGPGTCTPPGFWVYFAYCSAICQDLDVTQEALLFYKMTASLFQVGILAWKLKRRHLQERPIQSIRQLRPERDVLTFDGRTVSNKQWTPYQEHNFVTPPFPDFVSGHSSFSSVGARVLTDFFGTNVIPTSKQFKTEDMVMLSPILRGTDPKCTVCNLTVYPKTCEIDRTLPPTGLSMSWATWDEMAEDAGKSRIYGGIHYESSNQGGLALGRNLYNIMFP